MWFGGAALCILGILPITIIESRREWRDVRSRKHLAAASIEFEVKTAEIVLPALAVISNRFVKRQVRITRLKDKRRRTAIPVLTEILSMPEPLAIPHEPEPDYSSF